MPDAIVFGGIEGGGTKFVVAVADAEHKILRRQIIPTTTPLETLSRAADFLSENARTERLASVGVACFGPLDLNPKSATYGYVTTTPKTAWRNAAVVGFLEQRLHVPIGFETDVNSAALAEASFGAGVGLDPVIYVTVGTGIGGGAIVRGHPVHGLLHPEMGHVPVRRRSDDDFPGVCEWHQDCLEGLACGPALARRLGLPAHEAADEDSIWDLEAFYIAQGLIAITYLLSPQLIIVGGGVVSRSGLLARVREQFLELNHDYVNRFRDDILATDYIVWPQLGADAGVLGALELAYRAYPG